MFSRSSFVILATVFLGLFSQVHAHAAVSPMLGVNGTPVRNNVKKPSNANPCGAGINIAQSINNAQAVTAAADGSFTVTAISFNGGVDGSRQMTAQVSANGQGTNFVAATVTKNGDRAPNGSGNQQITAKLPANTKCTGGSSGNKCLVQFKSAAGFGNCVVVQQGGAAAGNARQGANARQGGTRAARAMLAEIAERGEEAIEVVKRKASQWIWA
ncbi:hypothetical protein NMY22_g6406 [Coprinellus aureogranulatus]|nr:hypothetical protein NMY22_g6406 [Coprinellus aureogranulatus]